MFSCTFSYYFFIIFIPYFLCNDGYVGTVGDGVMADTIRNYAENQGTSEETEAYNR